MNNWINPFVALFYMLSNDLGLVMIPERQYIGLNDRLTASEKQKNMLRKFLV